MIYDANLIKRGSEIIFKTPQMNLKVLTGDKFYP